MSDKFEQGCVDPAAEPLLGIVGFRSEPPHVAQQSRRDKLRVQHLPGAFHLLSGATGGGEYFEQALLSSSSAMLDFASTSTFQDGAVAGSGSENVLWRQDWMSSCVGGATAGGGVAASIQSPLYPCHRKYSSGISTYLENADLQVPVPSSSSPNNFFCNNTLQDVVTSSSTEIASLVQRNNIRDPSHPWTTNGDHNQLLLQQGNSSAVWLTERHPQQQNNNASSSSSQTLSLSLSSNPLPELHVAQIEERYGRDSFTPGVTAVAANDVSGYPKFAVSQTPMENTRRFTGPLGPFTGYATILKSSKFMKPAQQLLEEFCSVITGYIQASKQCEIAQERSSGVVTARDAPVISDNPRNSFYNSAAAVAATAVVGSANCTVDQGGGGGSYGDCQINQPEFQQKKAKLLYMQDEVCRRHKQYHQQMQMVVSSFESVAGLSAATPYTSLALKAVSKHFRCLKNAIADQLRHISKILGERFMSSSGSCNTSGTPRLNSVDQNLRKQKFGDGASGLMEHSQPVWRPQRGLPERSVAVLRAWLFEHFLHPYPSDTDKHMLASQTGLSRNQVSNWFINARVRLWKPMVEEIHMLETKGLNEMDLNSSNKNNIIPDPPTDDSGHLSSDPRSGPNQHDDYRIVVEDQWHREKRSRTDCILPGGMDADLMSFTTYPGGMDLGSLGTVSLTLGLPHNDSMNNLVHQQQQQQQQQIRRHFGAPIVHDFVG